MNAKNNIDLSSAAKVRENARKANQKSDSNNFDFFNENKPISAKRVSALSQDDKHMMLSISISGDTKRMFQEMKEDRKNSGLRVSQSEIFSIGVKQAYSFWLHEKQVLGKNRG